MKKRYEALYIGPNMCDGIWDNKTEEYLDFNTIEKLLNETNSDSVWEDRFKEVNKQKRDLQQRYRSDSDKMIVRRLTEGFENLIIKALENCLKKGVFDRYIDKALERKYGEEKKEN